MPNQLQQAPGGLDQLVKVRRKWKAFDLLKIGDCMQTVFAEQSPTDNSQFSFRRHPNRFGHNQFRRAGCSKSLEAL